MIHLETALIELGVAPSEYVLELNRHLTNPDDVPAPSRLYRFPIEYVAAGRAGDGVSRLLLSHPGLADLPFVRRVADAVGHPVTWSEEDEFGRERDIGEWWHAVDLMCEQHWRHLLDTYRLTDERCVLRAIQSSLGYGVKRVPADSCNAGWCGQNQGARCFNAGRCLASRKPTMDGRISIATARAILSWLSREEPADRSRSVIFGDELHPTLIEETNSKGQVTARRYPINLHPEDAGVGAWAMVHGLEDGHFVRRRDGFVEMTVETYNAKMKERACES